LKISVKFKLDSYGDEKKLSMSRSVVFVGIESAMFELETSFHKLWRYSTNFVLERLTTYPQPSTRARALVTLLAVLYCTLEDVVTKPLVTSIEINVPSVQPAEKDKSDGSSREKNRNTSARKTSIWPH
jgi:hypothetical protein